MSRLSRLAGLAAAVFVGGAVALSGAGAAHADTVTGTQVYLDDPKSAIKVINSKDTKDNPNGNETGAPRLGLKVAGASEPVLAYCIDFARDITDPAYVEAAWSSNKNSSPTEAELGQVQWVLTHAYPTVSADALLQAAKGTKPAGIDAELLKKLVYAGTQSAIWTITDGNLFALRDTNDGFNTGNTLEQYKVIVAVSEYLVKASKSPAADPQPKLEINPNTLTGEAGKKIGPFTVVSGGGNAALTAVGGKLVDADGKDVTSLPNGGKFYVVADAAGTVTIQAKGSGSVPIGRMFITAKKPNDTQKLILAGVAGTQLEAQATVTVTPPVPHLPVTGVKLTGAITAGVLLVAGGVALLLMVRRRRVRFTA
ncbi:thioester domain-containing protein [Dactylosporangium aurantiacum]|uniref:Thioester domain-containing protein n=1 Tax=Dactylosporangium aurantiacum TaxID=35754 RepID=A0A9Q9IE80_9ACTN|nr:thioester domain-containing protein [Dactylosporangium aurantiacum]UWZ54076.1 thioester domain-containing protein [Dactylosporangium aurantiacum]